MGPYMSQPITEKRYDQGDTQKISFQVADMQGWRTNMEDAHIAKINFEPECSLFGVFDGHGGKEVALFVEKHFIEELKQNQNFINRKMELALKEVFLKMDELMSQKEGIKELMQLKKGGEQSEDDSDMYDQGTCFAGCTANVVLIYKNEVYCANAGDSRSILGSDDQCTELSTDHKPDLPDEKRRITNAGGFVSEGRVNGNLNLSRALGDLEYKRDKDRGKDQQLISAVPEIKKVTLTKTDKFILMGCDGIWEKYTNQEHYEFVKQKLSENLPLKDIATKLLDRCLAEEIQSGLGCDNMTTIIILLKNLN